MSANLLQTYQAGKGLIPPLGGKGLCSLMVSSPEREALLEQSSSLKRVELSPRAYGDLIMLGIGGFTPLTGFMGRADWQSVCTNMCLTDGAFWPMPIVLDTDSNTDGLEGTSVLLTFCQRPAAILEVSEVWTMDEQDIWFECESIFRGKGKDSQNFRENARKRHPGVLHVFQRHKTYLAGRVKVLDSCESFGMGAEFMLTPSAFRKQAAERGWREIVCLQLRNPPHLSHEYLMRIGLEVGDALLIHTPMGALKEGDLPFDVRIRCITALVNSYLPAERVILAGYPLDMRYAGPREALLHAAFRQNYGISTQIVGRDHAGVADFYEPFEAQEIFEQIQPNADINKNLLTRPLRIRWPFYCKKCGTMASLNTCPHNMEDRVFHSGSLLRKSLAENTPPQGLARDEVLQVLTEYYKNTDSKPSNIHLYGAADGSSLQAGQK